MRDHDACNWHESVRYLVTISYRIVSFSFIACTNIVNTKWRHPGRRIVKRDSARDYRRDSRNNYVRRNPFRSCRSLFAPELLCSGLPFKASRRTRRHPGNQDPRVEVPGVWVVASKDTGGTMLVLLRVIACWFECCWCEWCGWWPVSGSASWYAG